jgi:hypothetical protein
MKNSGQVLKPGLVDKGAVFRGEVFLPYQPIKAPSVAPGTGDPPVLENEGTPGSSRGSMFEAR